ncbi:MAG: ABC transporter permease [Miniphocaeibacter sp.]|uniref:ABC transporter permease n=1 Tax=Miniphocaeibacter sp. TaxID=3100973 RepID=UPI003BB22491
MINNKSQMNSKEFLKKYSAFILLVIMLIVNAIITPNFFALNTFSLMLTQICPVILTAMGMTMVISTGGIDISVGAVMALAAALSTRFVNFEGKASIIMLAVGLLAAIILSSASGLVSGFMVGKLKVQPMVVTLGLMIGVRGLALVATSSKTVYISQAQGELYKLLGNYKIAGLLPIQIIPIILSIALVYFILNKTVLGRRIQAVGDNVNSARLAGINVTAVIIFVYMASAFLASAAGIFSVAKIGNINPNDVGLLAELDAIAAVVIGGTKMSGGRGRVFGTVIGAFIMSIISMAVNTNNIPYEYAQIVKAIIIVVAVYIQSDRKK